MGSQKDGSTFLTELDSESRKSGYKLRSKLPPIASTGLINYEGLKELSKEVEARNKDSREDAHRLFMDNYSTIFNPKPSSRPLSRTCTADKPKRNPEVQEKQESHNISDHTAKLHRKRISTTREARCEEKLKIIKKLAKKLPFDRSTEDNKQLLKCLRYLDCFPLMPKKVLAGLVATATLEKWEPDYTVFGDSGQYLILKGVCVPQTPLKLPGDPDLQRHDTFLSCASTSESHLQRLFTLTVGDCFGQLENSEPSGLSPLAVTTLEQCEMLRFSSTAYERVVKQVKEEESNEKSQLAQSCRIFHGWPTMALRKVSDSFTWSSKPAGEVLTSEGEMTSNIFFIKSGTCQQWKTLSVAFTYPDGKKVNKRKEVLTGTLGPGDSFGEKSVMFQQPIELCIIAETPLVIATIDRHDIEGLDSVTRDLFRQTCESFDSGTSEDIVKRNYIERQAEKEWQSIKDRIVQDALNYRGIMPGYSKWSRNPSIKDVQSFAGPSHQ
eukprot:Seg959.1 transcript_id=Seg959.1/GoldUCD/mRNA.D3Y31 product="Cyclic nucleotide-binding domain-containing protein 1" protein_id=Seg959.1/GoldUCD/D3Y31